MINSNGQHVHALAASLEIQTSVAQLDVALAEKNWLEAERLCRLLLLLAPDLPVLMTNLGLILCERGHPNKGFDLLKRVFKVYPEYLPGIQVISEASRKFAPPHPGQMLYAYYDFSVSLATFDFTSFLSLAASHCEEKHCAGFVIVCVPGDQDGFGNEGRQVQNLYDNEVRRWRKKHIVLSSAWLAPACQGVLSLQSREEARALFEGLLGAHTFPETYHPDIPVREDKLRHLIRRVKQGFTLPSYVPALHARTRVGQWLRDRVPPGQVPVSITLRQTTYFTPRNSNVGAWLDFARLLLTEGCYYPIFVRDEEAAMDPAEAFSGLALFDEAVWNVELRAALYDRCYLNLAASTGPLNVAYHNHRAATLTFKPVTESWSATSLDFFRREGMDPGGQHIQFKETHRIVWDDDDYDTIRVEFQKMCAFLESIGFVPGHP